MNLNFSSPSNQCPIQMSTSDGSQDWCLVGLNQDQCRWMRSYEVQMIHGFVVLFDIDLIITMGNPSVIKNNLIEFDLLALEVFYYPIIDS